jgi:hypothetical protein
MEWKKKKLATRGQTLRVIIISRAAAQYKRANTEHAPLLKWTNADRHMYSEMYPFIV